ncbi:MAG: hypothetical protein NVS2B3_11530 [Vulcanimicrobiaceae bacterium]
MFSIVAVCFMLTTVSAEAIPVFAHRYGLTCQTCHTEIPHLTPFGERFLARGYRLDGAGTHGTVPVAVKVKLAYATDADASGIPKAVADEIELLTGGSIGSRGSYFAETYLVDGGRPGSVRDAWAAYHVGSYARPASSAILSAGQFTLPLPIDPETFRETQSHYAIWDQVAGRNPFNFFDPHAGAALEFGSGGPTTLTVAALAGHDVRSGLPAYGTDRMAAVHHVSGPFVASAYRYDGSRRFDGAIDRFWRQGYALGLRANGLDVDAVFQHGFDSDAEGSGAGPGTRTSGGFVQARYAIGARDFALARFDGTNDASGPYRALVIGGGHRFGRNTRFTLEDTYTHAPLGHHAVSGTLLFAY